MKTQLILIVLTLAAGGAMAKGSSSGGSHSVKGYTTKEGT